MVHESPILLCLTRQIPQVGPQHSVPLEQLWSLLESSGSVESEDSVSGGDWEQDNLRLPQGLPCPWTLIQPVLPPAELWLWCLFPWGALRAPAFPSVHP